LNLSEEATLIEPISSGRAPEAIGPYSQAIKANGFLFPTDSADPNSQQVVEGDVARQTERVLNNSGHFETRRVPAPRRQDHGFSSGHE
jgi:enamine deaminase RidA (YjgF/YER057c/UK114 family)